MANNPTTVIVTDAGKIEIELLDPGVKPHRVLRYDLKEGVRESMEMELHMTMRPRSPAVSSPRSTPRRWAW